MSVIVCALPAMRKAIEGMAEKPSANSSAVPPAVCSESLPRIETNALTGAKPIHVHASKSFRSARACTTRQLELEKWQVQQIQAATQLLCHLCC